MTDTAPTAPTPNEVPTLGDTLSYSGLDANGNKSTQGLTAQAWSVDGHHRSELGRGGSSHGDLRLYRLRWCAAVCHLAG
jgi:hypothetical protein